MSSIPGVRCLGEMKASTDKRSHNSTYTTVFAKTGVATMTSESKNVRARVQSGDDHRRAVSVGAIEETHHRIASALDRCQSQFPSIFRTRGMKARHFHITRLDMVAHNHNFEPPGCKATQQPTEKVDRKNSNKEKEE